MIAARSPSVNRRFGVQRVCRLLERSRSSVYWARGAPARQVAARARPGPRAALSSDVLLQHIRTELSESPFVGEGHRKVWARLRLRGLRTSQRRVLRLMREAGLLAPTRVRRVLGPRTHDGTITTERPDVRWGIDATATWTLDDGLVTVFAAVDHCTAECVGIHAAVRGTRFEALEPLRQGLRRHFGGYAANCAAGLELRHDHGSQFTSAHFQSELAFLGVVSSPAFVRSPEGNGCIERFFRTLKEQLLWVRSFRNAEELRLALLEWIELYNERWLIERHGHRPPAAVRREHLALKASA